MYTISTHQNPARVTVAGIGSVLVDPRAGTLTPASHVVAARLSTTTDDARWRIACAAAEAWPPADAPGPLGYEWEV